VTRRAARGILALPALAVLGVILFWGLSGLPPFGNYHGSYGRLINDRALPERHVTNAVTAIVFDYRGVDTLGEEYILFAAVSGVVLLLRKSGGEEEQEEPPPERVTSDALRLTGLLALGASILVGLWLAAYGYVTPGGGFQGGAAIASGFVLLYLTVGYRAWRRRAKQEWLDPIEGIGAGGFVVVGLAALVSGLPFLTNLLGPGTPGTLLSGGSIAFVNWAAAIEVAAANTILFAEFLEQYIVPLTRERA
jgi:multicomponent Na+:H+ antiporter subunit B